MKKIFTSALWLTFVLFAFSQNVKASHITGVDFNYTCVGQDSFLVTLNIYRDCSGVGVGGNVSVTFTSTCGGSVTNVLSKQNGVNGTEVSQICPASISNSTCNGGTLFGIQQHIFSGIVVLSPACDTWSMMFTNCCRNSSVNMTNTSMMSINATLNSATSNCNNSPQFIDPPRSTVCVHQLVDYNLNVYEPDGDSLVYSFVIPNLSLPGTATYSPGYNVSSPIPGVVLNSANGQLTFTPAIVGLFIMAIQVCEYEYGTGLLKGCVVRDFQFYSIACSNTVTLPPTLGITNLSGNATLISMDTLQICAGNSFSFDLTFSDPDTADIVTITSNITTAMPGAVVSYSGTNPKTMSVFWSIPSGTPPAITLNVTATDSVCPISGIVTKVYTIIILERTDAGPDQTICLGTQWAQLGAEGGSTFSWSVITGSPIDTIMGSPTFNMTCSSCQNPQVSPSITTTYKVVSNLTGTCIITDTVTVFVAPNFNLSMPNDTLICSIDDFPLNTTTDQPFTYSYDWSPSNSLNYDSVQVPIANPNTPTNYELTVTSSGGCTKTGDVFIDLSAPFPQNSVISGDTVICIGSSNQLGIDFGDVVISECGPTTQGCIGTTQNGDIGTGSFTNTNSSYPCIYGGSKLSAHHQIMYRPNELINLGMTTGGILNSISFYINTLGNQQTFTDFQIKVGCTSQTDFSNGWVSLGNPLVVVPTTTYTATTGWNTHSFIAPYKWDGQSSLVFEICFNNPNNPSTPTNNIMPGSNSSFQSVIFTSSDYNSTCSAYTTLNFGAYTSSIRPNTRFNYCSGIDTNLLSFTWSPTISLSNSNITNPVATPFTATNYQVIVTEIGGVCADTLDLFVDVVNLFDAGFHFNDPYCISANTDVFTPNVGGGTFSGAGIDSNGVFDPALSGVGSFPITYSITSPASCANDSTINVVVIPLPDASIDYVEVCMGAAPINLTAANPGGNWSGVGIINSTNGTFNPQGLTPGFYTVYYELYQPCYNADTMAIKVIEPYQFSVDPYISVCEGATIDLNSNYTLSSAAGQGSGPVVATWTDANGAVNSNGIFDANNLSAGTYTVTLGITDTYGNCGTQKNMSITVLQTNVPEFPNAMSYCDQSNSGIITVVPYLFGTGTSYTQTPISPLTANDTLNIIPFGSNGKINPSTTGNGSWAISVTYTNLNGCTGIGTDTIYVLGTPINTITQNANGLSADAGSGYVYQWIDCATNQPIAGATNQTFAPTVAGSYAVQITAGSCTTTSDCINAVAVGISEPLTDFGITIYPNPTNAILSVDMGSNKELQIKITDFTGKEIISTRAKNKITTIDLSKYAAGVYVINLQTENGTATQKVVKQ